MAWEFRETNGHEKSGWMDDLKKEDGEMGGSTVTYAPVRDRKKRADAKTNVKNRKKIRRARAERQPAK